MKKTTQQDVQKKYQEESINPYVALTIVAILFYLTLLIEQL
jgi:hypothetical protein